MKRAILTAAIFIALGQAAVAGSASGPDALALAVLVAERSSAIAPADKALLRAYLDGRADTPHRRGTVLTVTADTVQCRASNVDITSHSCEIGFGWMQTTLNGRPAHELYATLAEIGVSPDGAAGSIYRSISRVVCTVTPDDVADRGGGGARCSFGEN